MIYKHIFLNNKPDYELYVKEQNVVADYNGDQTKKINYIEKYFKDTTKNIIDIGCRDGKFINRYAKLYNIYGIDIGDNSRIRADKNFGKDFSNKHIKILDVQKTDLYEQFKIKFDFINFSHVIEHLTNPDKALKNLEKVMHDKTEMLIIIPADLPRFMTIEKCIRHQPYHEIFWENKDDIISFIEKNNFDIINLEEVDIGKRDGEWRCLVKKKCV